MPFYEYDCPHCEQSFEKRVRMDEADQVRCPHCGDQHPKRRLARVSLAASNKSTNPRPAPAAGGL